MTEPAPRIDYANLPQPEEGILVTLFITVRSVARSRDFYARVLGGTVVLDENPCIVRLSNSWIIMNPGGPPTPDKPGISVVDYQPGDTTSIFLNLRVADIQACYEDWKEKGAEFVTPPIDREAETPLLHAGPGRISHRGRPGHRPAARQACREAPGGPPGLSALCIGAERKPMIPHARSQAGAGRFTAPTTALVQTASPRQRRCRHAKPGNAGRDRRLQGPAEGQCQPGPADAGRAPRRLRPRRTAFIRCLTTCW